MTETQTQPAARSVVMERTLPHALDKVWRALTESDLLAVWLLQNDFAAVPGRSFTLRAPAQPGWDGLVAGEVLEVEPKRRLSYSWKVGAMDTVVSFTLTPTEGGVHLRLEHSGFKEHERANQGGAAYGWRMFLDNLERLTAEL